jgi:hypothetical protein
MRALIVDDDSQLLANASEDFDRDGLDLGRLRCAEQALGSVPELDAGQVSHDARKAFKGNGLTHGLLSWAEQALDRVPELDPVALRAPPGKRTISPE